MTAGFNGMWAQPGHDPRPTGSPVGELATLRQYLTYFRDTLALKCDGLTPEQLAARSVPPSTLSLLGLVRHMAKVEQTWFERVLQGRTEKPRLFWSDTRRDVDFDDAVGEPAAVEEAVTAWREQIAAADRWLDSGPDLDARVSDPHGEPAGVRDILVHMVEEYARHCGHADLLRECVDGRTGQ